MAGVLTVTKPTSVDQMATRSFIDTNVLIYAEACDTPAKQRAALALLKQLYEGMEGVVSTQLLQEYCNAALKKLKTTGSTRSCPAGLVSNTQYRC